MNRYQAHRPSVWRFRLTVAAEALVLAAGMLAILFLLTLDGVR